MNEELLLTKAHIREVAKRMKGTSFSNIVAELVEFRDKQLAKAKPIIEKQEKERINIVLDALEKEATGVGLVKRGMRGAVNIIRQTLKGEK